MLMKKHLINIFFQKLKLKIYNVEIDSRNFYDQAINYSIKQYDKVRKISAGRYKVMITQLVVYQVLLILKRIID